MQRYFIEVAYMGTTYSGFQTQQNAKTIQSEVELALKILYKEDIRLTGSSRTDAGVHADQNFFHTDSPIQFLQHHIYHLNAILPQQIVIKNIYAVADAAHCRFDASARRYEYHIVRKKNPFLQDRSFYFPYKIDFDLLEEMAVQIKIIKDFTSFAKRHSQVKNFNCQIQESFWKMQDDVLIYTVQGNRFLRGMVRGLTGTMLKLSKQGKGAKSLLEIADAKNCAFADFSVPGRGLFLKSVIFDSSVYEGKELK